MPPPSRVRKRSYGVYSGDWGDDDDEPGSSNQLPKRFLDLQAGQGKDELGTQICIGASEGDGKITRTKLVFDGGSVSAPSVGGLGHSAINDHDASPPQPSVSGDRDEGPPIQLPPAPSLTPYECTWSFEGGLDGGDEEDEQEEEMVCNGTEDESPQNPQEDWMQHYREEYLREMIWLEGRGQNQSSCTDCGVEGRSVYRCKSCIGSQLLCRSCIVSGHQRNPFHFIEMWNGSHFEGTTLKSLGLTVQLGHPPGQSCDNPTTSRHDDFVVIDTTGIHEVSLLFCGCDGFRPRHVQLLRYGLFPGTGMDPRSAASFRALKFFQIMSFESKGSHEEFYRAIVRLTGNVKIKPSRDRYHEFMVMISQWRHLKMLKRAGRGHDSGGIAETSLGSCAIRCPACPQPGINLPEDWRSAPPGKRWIYRLFVSIDGNFKLKRRLVSSDEKDPGYNSGWAYFVEDRSFREHLSKEWNTPQDRSTCVAHDAVDKPDREARGLAASGVVAVVCTRHEFRLPNSVGDLQKGERYSTVDFVTFSGTQWFKILELVIAYDIACQWIKKLFERLESLPPNLRPTHLQGLTALVPKFHLPAHVEYCNRTFSFNLTQGVGRTDGEAAERGWSRMNTAGKSTTEMGPGKRRDTLDDHMANENWDLTKRLAQMLKTRMERAVDGKAKHAAGLAEYQENIPDKFVKMWIREVELWEDNPAVNHNPFEAETSGVSEQAVRLQLAQEAEAEDADDDVDVGVMHPALFISSGIQLEEDQHKLHIAASELGNHPTKKQLTTLAERSNTLRRRIAVWMEVQKLYMPDAEATRRQQDLKSTALDGKPAIEAYEIPLLLPSSLPSSSCTPELIRYESKLREGQAYDALNEIRRYLRLRSYLYKRKDANARGVAANTRSNTAIKRAQKGVDTAAIKYTRAYTALTTLRGKEATEGEEDEQWRRDLRVLKSSHLRGLSEGLFGETEGTREISWIWKSRSAPATPESEENIEADEQLQDALRIEFLKARARSLRWDEEVTLLEEEMRRSLQFFQYKSEWWFSRQFGTIGGSSEEYGEGYSAYALSQCSVYQTLLRQCQALWKEGRESNWVKKVQKGGRKKAGRKDKDLDGDDAV